MLNNVSRSLSDVGRSPSHDGAFSRRPFSVPAMTRIGMGKWGDGKMGKWGNGEMGESIILPPILHHLITPLPHHPITPLPHHPITPWSSNQSRSAGTAVPTYR